MRGLYPEHHNGAGACKERATHEKLKLSNPPSTAVRP